jgi:hypothetical protein
MSAAAVAASSEAAGVVVAGVELGGLDCGDFVAGELSLAHPVPATSKIAAAVEMVRFRTFVIPESLDPS